jgi:hypothetical protein
MSAAVLRLLWAQNIKLALTGSYFELLEDTSCNLTTALKRIGEFQA